MIIQHTLITRTRFNGFHDFISCYTVTIVYTLINDMIKIINIEINPDGSSIQYGISSDLHDLVSIHYRQELEAQAKKDIQEMRELITKKVTA